MKLYIKRDVSDAVSRFSVLDCDLKEKYRIIGTKSCFGEKLIIPDRGKTPLLCISRVVLPFCDAFFVSAKNEGYRLTVTKSRGAMSCRFYGISWRIRGDLITKSYDILDADNTVIATHIKRWSSSGFGCELNIFDESRELFCIAAVTCINSIITAENTAAQPL